MGYACAGLFVGVVWGDGMRDGCLMVEEMSDGDCVGGAELLGRRK